MSRGAATPKQANILRKYNLPANVSFEQASAMLDQLKQQAWNPAGIVVPPPPPAAPQQGQYPQAPYGAPQQQYGQPAAPYGAPAPQYQPPYQPTYAPPAAPYGGPVAAPVNAPATNGGCTPKQAEILAKYNYPTNVSFDTASQILDQLKNNNWQPLPNGGAPAPQQPQYVAPPNLPFAAPATPQFDGGATPPWGPQTPQFAGVPSFGS